MCVDRGRTHIRGGLPVSIQHKLKHQSGQERRVRIDVVSDAAKSLLPEGVMARADRPFSYS